MTGNQHMLCPSHSSFMLRLFLCSGWKQTQFHNEVFRGEKLQSGKAGCDGQLRSKLRASSLCSWLWFSTSLRLMHKDAAKRKEAERSYLTRCVVRQHCMLWPWWGLNMTLFLLWVLSGCSSEDSPLPVPLWQLPGERGNCPWLPLASATLLGNTQLPASEDYLG